MVEPQIAAGGRIKLERVFAPFVQVDVVTLASAKAPDSGWP
jgi:hypothetical protein